MYQTLITTGLRGSELIGMLWDMIDWEGGQIKLTSHLKQLHRTRRWVRLRLKNNKNRTIPLDDLLLEALRAHRERQIEEKQQAGVKWKGSGLIFPTSIGTPFEQNNLLKDLQRDARRAGIGEITTHELRHTAGSLMLQDGKTMTVVSKVLGHSSVAVTQSTYAQGYGRISVMRWHRSRDGCATHERS
jgi:integrase